MTVKPFKIFFLILLTVLCISRAGAAQPRDVTVEKDIQFTEQGGIPLELDVFIPAGEGPFPVMVAVHGGGFVRGDKDDIARQCRVIAGGGYLVINANYRTMSMGIVFPEFVKDIHTAVKWARKNAADYGGDPERMAIMGFSAGAYIASIVGVTSHVPQLQHKNDGFEEMDSGVSAVVSFYGHQNLTILDETQRQTASLIWGGKISEKALRLSSPSNYLDHAVPKLMFHNETDHLVPVEQSRNMYEIMKEAGIPVYYFEFPEKAHDLLRPDEDWALGVTIDFLDRYLRGKSDIVLPDSIPPRK